MRRPFTLIIVAVLTFAVGVAASIFLRGVLSPFAGERSNPTVLVAEAPPPVVSEQAWEAPKSAISGGVLTIRGGILNGKAISLPKPAYPAIARAAHASGIVKVFVTIDEDGYVISSRAIAGHPLLQEAAVQTVRQARFSPTLLSGQPVKVTGVIVYNFVGQ
ncbi:MAG: periplasmic protein TonB [Acidobacteriota bacterium]|jgi:protein TonB|nr:periplasmic protein TonB [Acidobacteriota bacterium]